MSKQLKIYTIADKKEEDFLRDVNLPVNKDEFKSKEFQRFLDDMLFTALNSEEQVNMPAGGLSAPQVGEHKRVFWVLNYDTDVWHVFINPEVTPLGFTKTSTQEGCLSVPNVMGDVLRYKRVKIKYQDRNGEWKTEKYNDLNAISIQHEIDHLNGILFIDRIE